MRGRQGYADNLSASYHACVDGFYDFVRTLLYRKLRPAHLDANPHVFDNQTRYLLNLIAKVLSENEIGDF